MAAHAQWQVGCAFRRWKPPNACAEESIRPQSTDTNCWPHPESCSGVAVSIRFVSRAICVEASWFRGHSGPGAFPSCCTRSRPWRDEEEFVGDSFSLLRRKSTGYNKKDYAERLRFKEREYRIPTGSWRRACRLEVLSITSYCTASGVDAFVMLQPAKIPTAIEPTPIGLVSDDGVQYRGCSRPWALCPRHGFGSGYGTVQTLGSDGQCNAMLPCGLRSSRCSSGQTNDDGDEKSE